MAVISRAWEKCADGFVVLLIFWGLLCVWLPAEAAHAMEREAVRRILLESRHLGAHGLGYNAQSQLELAKKLPSQSIPVLLDLLTHDKDARAGAIFGLASQCGAAIEPIKRVVASAAVPLLYWSDLQEALALIERGSLCSREDKRRAAEAGATLGQRIEAEYDERRQAAQAEKARQAALTKRGLLMLDPEGRKSVSINECLELVWESTKAMGIDPTTSEASQQLLNRQIANCYGLAPRSVN